MAVPVKYMVVTTVTVSGATAYWADVIDTSFEGRGRTVAKCSNLSDAHKVCASLNYMEGYEYYAPTQQ